MEKTKNFSPRDLPSLGLGVRHRTISSSERFMHLYTTAPSCASKIYKLTNLPISSKSTRSKKIRAIVNKFGHVSLCERNVELAIQKQCRCSEIKIMQTVASFFRPNQPYRCEVSLKYLSSVSGVSRSSVQAAIERLKKKGYIAVDVRQLKHQTNRYELQHEKLLNDAFPQVSKTGPFKIQKQGPTKETLFTKESRNINVSTSLPKRQFEGGFKSLISKFLEQSKPAVELFEKTEGRKVSKAEKRDLVKAALSNKVSPEQIVQNALRVAKDPFLSLRNVGGGPNRLTRLVHTEGLKKAQYAKKKDWEDYVRNKTWQGKPILGAAMQYCYDRRIDPCEFLPRAVQGQYSVEDIKLAYADRYGRQIYDHFGWS